MSSELLLANPIAHSVDVDPAAIYAERRVRSRSALDGWANGLLGHLRHRLPLSVAARANAVTQALGQCEAVAAMSDAEICTGLHRAAPRIGHSTQQLARALALVRESARRSLGLMPFATQLLGATILLDGKLAEMQTGEGKTLTAGLAAAIVACGRTPVHVITVNDYLAERDSEKLAPLCRFLGLSVGVILTSMDLDQRRPMYACDITYCTGKEVVFDYLKDKVAKQSGVTSGHLALRGWVDGERSQSELLLRGLHFAIVDEADSIFIDEARTPLILSRNAGMTKDATPYATGISLAQQLEERRDYRVRPATRELELTEHGRARVADLALGLGPDWAVKVAREHQVEQALRALHLFHRDQHYVVKEDKVMIVDEQTGRVLEGRTWEQGLHQMIEVKEGTALSDQALTVARITYQRFFRKYLRLSGMTGTGLEVRSELWSVYGLQTVAVPTHRPCIRRVFPIQCHATETQKWEAVCESIASMRSLGRPVLVGTRSVEASERLSRILAGRGVAHRVLNALQDAHEALVVETAGEAGMVTVATNMAGRGTDIALAPGVADSGGLHVILSEFHDSRRVDRQLFGRAARQGDPGSAQAIVSLDDLLIVYQAPWLARLLTRWRLVLVTPASIAALRWHCQRGAESMNTRSRKAATRSDQNIESMLSFSGRN